jgi:thiosulfate/3-mercaptopyruvate sulfurtransferase
MSEVTTEELARRLDEEGLVLLDVRSEGEFDGIVGYPCDARQGHVPGAVNLDVNVLAGAGGPEAVRELVGAPEGAEVIAYCHSGGRSAFAVQVLRAAGYDARNYEASWHAWSASPELPIE